MYPYNITFSGDFIISLMSNIEGKVKEQIIYNNH